MTHHFVPCEMRLACSGRQTLEQRMRQVLHNRPDRESFGSPIKVETPHLSIRAAQLE